MKQESDTKQEFEKKSGFKIDLGKIIISLAIAAFLNSGYQEYKVESRSAQFLKSNKLASQLHNLDKKLRDKRQDVKSCLDGLEQLSDFSNLYWSNRTHSEYFYSLEVLTNEKTNLESCGYYESLQRMKKMKIKELSGVNEQIDVVENTREMIIYKKLSKFNFWEIP